MRLTFKPKKIIGLIAVTLILISCASKKEIEDTVVIGGGLMGSSTAWQLSKNGTNVLLIEQQSQDYTFGSSFGEARISRNLGPKGDVFSYLQQTSVNETKNLINYLNDGETTANHSMEDIYTTSPVTYIYSATQQNDVENLLHGQTIDYQYATNPYEAREKFGMQVSDDTLVLREYKEYSGTLNPQVLIKKLHQGVIKSGSNVSYNQKVTRLEKVNGIYEIDIIDTKTNVTKTIWSKNVIAAAGPYNGRLVKDIAPYFSDLIHPKRLFLSFLKIKADKYDSLTLEQKSRLHSSYPVAYLNAEIFYSMIEKFDEDNRPLLKVGGHFLRTDISDLDKVWEQELTPQEIFWSKSNTADYLRKLDLPLTESDLIYHSGYSCVYSLTESEIPYVTPLINHDRTDPSFALIGGMSGVGAKASLAYGSIAADIVLGNDNNSFMHQKAKSSLGAERLMKDLQDIKELTAEKKNRE